ncbi:1-acylglycerol-3-phosphate O-acyltransferase Pnpla3-like isoform X2 [Cydia pomonella]|uniref:1-acylglycerol-3-phosphate O-acyltransferase Pnpla3-like isoform X2 n=1 Tax=Cydia pomonella TaxID=82600 RepID=UPI002ADE564D|nr:1-acylglycerol-3-phosphate O-acyltransferase Pnpla3-like isoform X2 [Cydia pomonella]
MNLSFAGCGFLGIYHVGVAVCFKKYAPHLLLGKISGASFGALSACCLLCDVPIGEITSDVLRVVGEARAGSLGPFSPSFNIQNVLLEGMDKYLPQDVHKIVSGKLHISLTRVYDGKNVIVSEFPTRQDLMQALLASCFVPVFSGVLPPRFHGIRYMDGGFSDNLPVLDENTITVSPFCGESDICPRDLSSQLFHVSIANTSIELSKQNINRFVRILFPPKPEVLSNMCKQGFDDALRFLQRNNMISCTRCLAVQSTFQLQEVLDDTVYDYDPDCEECKTHRQDALEDDLPDTVMSIFQNAIDSANHGIVNWVLRQRAVRYLSIMTLPYRVPIDIMYATLTNGITTFKNGRGLVYEDIDLVTANQQALALLDVAKRIMSLSFVACTPKMTRSLWKLSLNLIQQLHAFLYSAHDRSEAAAQIYYKLTMDAKKEVADGRQVDRRRASEMRISYGDVLADDTFEHILNVTSHHDALLAYYYLDSDNKRSPAKIRGFRTQIRRQILADENDRDIRRDGRGHGRGAVAGRARRQRAAGVRKRLVARHDRRCRLARRGLGVARRAQLVLGPRERVAPTLAGQLGERRRAARERPPAARGPLAGASAACSDKLYNVIINVQFI